MDAWAIYVIVIAAILLIKAVVVVLLMIKTRRNKRRREEERAAYVRAYTAASQSRDAGMNAQDQWRWMQQHQQQFHSNYVEETDMPPSYDEVAPDAGAKAPPPPPPNSSWVIPPSSSVTSSFSSQGSNSGRY